MFRYVRLVATFRAMTTADFDRVVEINQANIPAVGPIDRDRLGSLVADAEVALVAETADTVAGFCIVLGPNSAYDSVNYRWFMDRFDDAWYLDRVAFDAAFQGLGLGTALYAEVEAVIRRCRDAGAAISRLTLEVNVDPPNEQSLAFHDRRGFTEVGRQRTPYDTEVSLMANVY